MKTKTSLDTETEGRITTPFVMTTCTKKGSKLLDLKDPKDFIKAKTIAEDDKTPKIFHNAAYDIYALSNIGINVVPPYHDTMIKAALIDMNYESRGLKPLAKAFLKEKCEEEKALSKVKAKYKRLAKKEKRQFWYSDIPAEILRPYAIKDAEYTLSLDDYFDRVAPDVPSSRLYNMELALIPILVKMSRRGVLIDRTYCELERDNLSRKIIKAYNEIIRITGKFMNPLSPKQIDTFIREETDIAVRGALLPKKKFICTDKEAMKVLKPLHSVFQHIENYRAFSKLKSTYYDSLLDEYTTPDDPVAHFLFYQSGAKTGRFSADLVQTIPKHKEDREDPLAFRVRKAFICRPGFINFYFDYDQIEMRLFAHFSRNLYLINAINRGEDPHQATADDLFGKGASKDHRRIAKNINFGIIYGEGLEKLIEQLGLSRHEGHDILNRYHQKYRVKEYIRNVTGELFRTGKITLDWIGRDYKVPKELAYKGVNVIIQGSAAYIIKLAMLAAAKKLSEKYPEAHMLLTIHDELVFEVPEYYDMQQFAYDMRETMSVKSLFDVPLTVGIDWSHTNWFEKRAFKCILQ